MAKKKAKSKAEKKQTFADVAGGVKTHQSLLKQSATSRLL